MPIKAVFISERQWRNGWRKPNLNEAVAYVVELIGRHLTGTNDTTYLITTVIRGPGNSDIYYVIQSPHGEDLLDLGADFSSPIRKADSITDWIEQVRVVFRRYYNNQCPQRLTFITNDKSIIRSRFTTFQENHQQGIERCRTAQELCGEMPPEPPTSITGYDYGHLEFLKEFYRGVMNRDCEHVESGLWFLGIEQGIQEQVIADQYASGRITVAEQIDAKDVLIDWFRRMRIYLERKCTPSQRPADQPDQLWVRDCRGKYVLYDALYTGGGCGPPAA